MKKMLVHNRSAAMQPLVQLLARQNHRTLVLWAFDCAARVLPIFTARYPADERPAQAIAAARAWGRGAIKMPEAKRAADRMAHAAARDVADDPAASAAARAAGHCIGTVHVGTHAIACASYAVTACMYAAEPADRETVATREIEWLYDRLLYWQANSHTIEGPWAAFLLRD